MNANEMHFHEVDRKWIIEAMEEYAALRQPPVIKSVCDKCEELQAEVNRCYEAMDAKKGIIG